MQSQGTSKKKMTINYNVDVAVINYDSHKGRLMQGMVHKNQPYKNVYLHRQRKKLYVLWK